MTSARTGGRSLLNRVNDMEDGFVSSAVCPNEVATGEDAYCDGCSQFGEIGGDGRNFGTGFLQPMSRLELLPRKFLVWGSCRSREYGRAWEADI